jgi:hypothetical protein
MIRKQLRELIVINFDETTASSQLRKRVHAPEKGDVVDVMATKRMRFKYNGAVKRPTWNRMCANPNCQFLRATVVHDNLVTQFCETCARIHDSKWANLHKRYSLMTLTLLFATL